MIPAIPYLLALASSYRLYSLFSTVSAFLGASSIVNSVDSYHQRLSEDETRKVSDSSAPVDSLVLDKPIPSQSVAVTVSNPSTLPDFLTQNNQLVASLIEQQHNSVEQLQFQNSIQTEILKVQAKSSVHLDTLTSILNTTLPAIVIQLQEVSKIAGALSIKSDIDTAYKELAITQHEQLVSAIQTLELSPVINNEIPVPDVLVNVPVPSVTVNAPDQTLAINNLKTATDFHTLALTNINDKLTSVSENAVAQKKVADYKTTVAQITRLDGSIYAELTPQELATKKDISLAEAKVKEKEIGDYQTTVKDISNLDGNIVATMKPMEMTVVKNAVNARNATDEMEFEIPDNVIDNFLGAIPLPTYTNQDFFANSNNIYSNWSV